MFLSGQAIQHEVATGRFTIAPFRAACVKPASYVLSLGKRFRRWKSVSQPLILWSPNAASNYLDEPFDAQSVTMFPGEFLLSCTAEDVSLPADRVGTLSPLSHITRFGLSLHGGADLVSPGYGLQAPSRLTLELTNHNASPLELTAGMPIAHLRISPMHVDTSVDSGRVSIYEGADPVVAPKLYEEWSRIGSLSGKA